MLLSIIVPVYNVELYLERCIESLLRQGLSEDNYEIILVNDGSTDHSLDICQHYARLRQNIRIVSQDNQGLGAARNTGIRYAHGDYLCFVDSDDYLSGNGLAGLTEHCKTNIDLIRYWCRIICKGTEEEGTSPDGTVIYIGNGTSYLRQYGLETFCWNYLYRKEFLLSNHLWFENIIGEDFRFINQVLFANPEIVSLAWRIYNYHIRPSSISTTKTSDNSRRWVNDTEKTLKYFLEIVKSKQSSDERLYESCMESIENKMLMLISRTLTAKYTNREFREIAQKYKSMGLFPLSRKSHSWKLYIGKKIANLLFDHFTIYIVASKLYCTKTVRTWLQTLDRNK